MNTLIHTQFPDNEAANIFVNILNVDSCPFFTGNKGSEIFLNSIYFLPENLSFEGETRLHQFKSFWIQSKLEPLQVEAEKKPTLLASLITSATLNSLNQPYRKNTNFQVSLFKPKSFCCFSKMLFVMHHQDELVAQSVEVSAADPCHAERIWCETWPLTVLSVDAGHLVRYQFFLSVFHTCHWHIKTDRIRTTRLTHFFTWTVYNNTCIFVIIWIYESWNTD